MSIVHRLHHSVYFCERVYHTKIIADCCFDNRKLLSDAELSRVQAALDNQGVLNDYAYDVR